MATLHHGILVDPNSSKEIADALLKILTEPKEWEAMSQNGVDNIMAYSWPSHCKQVLESLEKEKQYVKTHTVRHATHQPCCLQGLPDERHALSPSLCSGIAFLKLHTLGL